MESSQKIVRIKGSIKHYDWGGKTFLPQLLHLDNADQRPFAEYWLGDRLEEGFDKVPYLLKVLDVEKMLSIQVHPTRKVAQAKFQWENDRGIALNAPTRNYKDANHKPELLSPLGDFYLLHGFKPQAAMRAILERVPDLQFLRGLASDYRELYTRVMTMPQHEVNEMLQPLLDRIIPKYEQGLLQKDQEDFWAARAALTFNKDGQVDRGIFSIYLFNVVHMTRGQALFQDAGLPHAYLEGQTIEIMANSDNVLRGGLTPKHIDVRELLEQVVYAPTLARVIEADASAGKEEIFPTPAADFQLSRIQLNANQQLALPARRVEIYFVYEGAVTAVADGQEEEFHRGDAFLAVPGTIVHLGTTSAAVLYRAVEPLVQ